MSGVMGKGPADPLQGITVAHYLCLAVDVQGYGMRDDYQQGEVQAELMEVLDVAASRAGLSRESWIRQPKGDEELCLISDTESFPKIAGVFCVELAALLHRRNCARQPWDWLRLRLALDDGPAEAAPNGFVGRAVISASRLLNCAPARQFLRTAKDANLVVVVSQGIYRDWILSGRAAVPAELYRRVSVVEKEFIEDAWFWVPGTDAHNLSVTADPMSPAMAGDGATTDRGAMSSTDIQFFDLSTSDGERHFYKSFNQSIAEARESVWRFASGLTRSTREAFLREILHSEENALLRGVEMIRIQTIPRVLASWADGCAALMERFPSNYQVLAGHTDPPFVDMGLIDPFGSKPTILLIFQLREVARTPSRLVAAMVIRGQRSLAVTLGHEFTRRAATLLSMTPSAMRELARIHIYFAHGVHMAFRRIRRDVPDARSIGPAVLRAWSRNVEATVTIPLVGPTIAFTGRANDYVQGVAYELSNAGKVRLDEIEGRAYQPRLVEIEIGGKRVPAYTYLPLDALGPGETIPAGSALELLIDGARENGLTDLLTQLLRVQPIRDAHGMQ